MHAVWRATAILIDPAAEWTRIEQEADDPLSLFYRYVALLALIPATFGFIGVSVIGVVVPGGGVVRASLFAGLLGAFFLYAEAFAAAAVLGLIINVLAPLFGGRRSFADAFKLAVYSCTPVWLAGVFLLLPGLHFLMLTGLYGGYLLLLGLPVLMKSPERRSFGFAVVIILCAGALAALAALAQHRLFGLPGL